MSSGRLEARSVRRGRASGDWEDGGSGGSLVYWLGPEAWTGSGAIPASGRHGRETCTGDLEAGQRRQEQRCGTSGGPEAVKWSAGSGEVLRILGKLLEILKKS